MATYQAKQLRAFLESVDRHLRKPVRLVVIGGGAALLQHGAKSATRDIDIFEGDTALTGEACLRAGAEIGFAVPIQSAAIADLPLHYEDRLERPLPHLKKLNLFVPDRYDLVLRKLVRASQADLTVCQEIHRHKPLDQGVLLERYLAEMNHAIGRQADRDQNLLAAIEYLWNAAEADEAERDMKRFRHQPSALVSRSRKKPPGRHS